MGDASPIGALGDFGPFFALDVHPDEGMPDVPWQPLTCLLEPAGIRDRIRLTRAALARTARCQATDVPWRVAASVTHLGVIARFVSPGLAVLTMGAGALEWDPARTWWQSTVGGPMPLSVAQKSIRQSVDQANAGLLVAGVLRTLTELFAAESVSRQVLWGNVASALAGAYTVMVNVRPELALVARNNTRNALHSSFLSGMSNGTPGPGFRRNNCCLMYRIGAPASDRSVCGDCVLRRPSALG